MSDQLIQIVDEQDNPIGEATITEARSKGLFHRISRVMVEDKDGNILLQKRAPDMRSYPSCWDNSAAGHVDVGETYQEAAKRELFEETGIKNITLLQLLGSYFTDSVYESNQIRRFNKVYKLILDRNTKTTPDPHEVSELKWFKLSEVVSIVNNNPKSVTDGLIDVMNRYYKPSYENN